MRKEIFCDGTKRSEQIAISRLTRTIGNGEKFVRIRKHLQLEGILQFGTASTSSPFTPKRQLNHRPRSILVQQNCGRGFDRRSPTNSTDSPPPPLPQRNRIGPGGAPPPILPPKPEPRQRGNFISGSGSSSPTVLHSPMLISTTQTTNTTVDQEADDENANSRRSVADMARIFNK
ncbi:unnamed protein product [Caenorhabditis angaria]|uniref:Uncharacterized protein n=1 Tax=Caenorhabditis angaria TaxID=860376 RepID=A0A9P1MU09_9PELO|nr:unnamed protein product [Caenorhabditis angaria]